ncbi:MAG: transposase [Pyrinomonadaceae bacterium]
MWNDTDEPLAYLITFRCYGTWLHGDGRGAIDRNHNAYGSAYMRPSEEFESFNAEELKMPPVRLNARQRRSVIKTIREVCEYKGWRLIAMNVRTNHVHVLVSAANVGGSMILSSLKSYSTRRLRENGLWEMKESPWSRRGSKRLLWNETSVARAADYVVNGQGGPLPEFD